MEFRTSKLKTGFLLILAILMVAACLFVATMPDPKKRAVGILGAGFFGLALLILVKQFFNKAPLLVFDSVGIHSYSLQYGTIPWDEIKSISLHSVKGTKFMAVDVENAEPYLARLPAYRASLARMNLAIGTPPITLSLQGMDHGFDEALAYIRANHPDLLTE